MSSIFDSVEEPASDTISTEILSVASYLHPNNPEPLASKSMIPYFESCGMAEDHIVPGGLKEYAEAVFKILNLKATPENLNKILEREDVRKTITSAIAAANKVHDARMMNQSSIDSAMPDMSTIQGIDEQTMRHFVQKAEKEKAMSEANNFGKEEEVKDEPEKLPDVSDVKNNPAVFCPRCGWAVNKPYNKVELTDEDRAQFAYSIMQRKPFKKKFGLFDNQMTVTFRSRVPEDNDKVLEQVRKDIKAEVYTDINSMTAWTNMYDVALLLDDITMPSNENVKASVKPQLSEFKDSPNEVRDYTLAVLNDYIATDALMHLIMEKFKFFIAIYDALVDEALSENFHQPA